MNTSFLSSYVPLPTAPASQQAPIPRSADTADEAVSGSEGVAADETEEASGDTDKADAFAAMLAALMSVTNSPTAEAPVSSVPTTGVESVAGTGTGAVTDIPRDGAGAPLFTSTYLTANPQAATTAGMTTTAVAPIESKVVDPTATAVVANVKPAEGSVVGSAVGDAALSDLAELGSVDGETASAAPPPAVASTSEMDASSIDAGDATLVSADSAELHVVAMKVVDADPSGVVETSPTVPSGKPTVEATSPDLAESSAPEPVATAETKLEVQPTQEPEQSESVTDSSTSVTQDKATPPTKNVGHPDAQDPKLGPTVVQNAGVEEPNEKPPESKVTETALPESSAAHSRSPRPAGVARPQETPGSATPAESAIADPETVIPPVSGTTESLVNRDATRRPSVKADVEAAPTKIKADVLEADLSLTSSTGVPQAGTTAAASLTASHDAAAAATPAHVSQQVMQALTAFEAELPAGGSRSFELLLDPPELGRLIVQMSRTSKGVDVRIAAENETVRSILESSGQELQQGLQLSGFDLGQFSGSSSNGGFANGEEMVFAPSLQSFGTTSATAATPRTVTSVNASRAVNVVV